MSQRKNNAKLLFQYKPNPTQEDINDSVNWSYHMIEEIHKELLDNFHQPIETEEKHLSINKGNLFIF